MTCAVGTFVFEPQYQTNDDVAMNMFASGVGLSGQPSPFLLFPNIIYGKLLSTLYSLWPDWPWYRLIAIVVQLVSALVITSAVAGAKRVLPLVGLAFIFFPIFDLYAYCRPQFTIVAAYPALAALVLWFMRLSHPRSSPAAGAAIVGLLTLSSMIRFESAVLVCLVALPVVLFHLGRTAKTVSQPALDPTRRKGGAAGAAAGGNRENKCDIRGRSRFAAVMSGILPLCCAVLLMAGLQIWHRWCYSNTPGWGEFTRFNAARGDFLDYDRVTWSEESRPVFAQAGWSENDFRMFRSWYAADTQLFSLDHVSQIARHFPRARSDASVSTTAQAILGRWQTPELRLLMLAAIVVAWAACRGWMQFALATVELGWTAVLTIAFVWFLKLPDYNWFVICASLAAVLSLAPSASRTQFGRVGRALHGGVLLAALGLLIWHLPDCAKRLWGQSESARQAQLELREVIARIAPQPNQLYLAWGPYFPYEYTSPLAGMQEYRDFKLLGISGCQQTPIAFARMREFGIENLSRATYERNDVLIIASEGDLSLLERYVLEHSGVNVGHRCVHSSEFASSPGRKFEVFRMQFTGTPSPSRTEHSGR